MKMLQFSNLGKDCNISHFITTRHGGVSKGTYASMNLGEYCGDDPESVSVNRNILCGALGITTDKLITPFQVHGNDVVLIDKSFIALSREERTRLLHGVDALITQEKGFCIAVSTADCVPVLLYAPDKNIIASIHAGWRGTVAQIVGKTVQQMVDRFGCEPARMLGAIGPSISQDSFEVGEEVLDVFSLSGADVEAISKRNGKTGKAHLDLWKENERQLMQSGLQEDNIETLSICTYIEQDDFFSARRLGIKSGRMLTGIMIKG